MITIRSFVKIGGNICLPGEVLERTAAPIGTAAAVVYLLHLPLTHHRLQHTRCDAKCPYFLVLKMQSVLIV